MHQNYPNWIKFVWLDETCPNLQNESNFSKLDQTCPIWINFDQTCPKSIKLVLSLSDLFKMDKIFLEWTNFWIGLNLSKLEQTCSKWITLVWIGSNLFKLDQIFHYWTKLVLKMYSGSVGLKGFSVLFLNFSYFLHTPVTVLCNVQKWETVL